MNGVDIIISAGMLGSNAILWYKMGRIENEVKNLRKAFNKNK